MADWIKVETISSQKIEVLTMADILDMDEHMVFGKLVILWCWADANTVDGNAQNVTKRMIDRVACNAGFADAMLDERVGWLKEDESGNLSFSNFDRHNGKGAKKRATTARRVKEHRENVTTSSQTCNAQGVTKAIPEKRREDKNRKEKDTLSASADAISVLTYLNEVFSSKYRHTTKSHIDGINARLDEGHSVDDCKAVIDHKFKEWGSDEKMAQYLRPATLFQPGKFQGYLMAAKANTPKQTKTTNDFEDQW